MNLYLFDRKDRIIHFEDLSILKKAKSLDNTVQLTMSQNEVFVFQLAAVSQKDDVITDISSVSDLEISCINTDVTDKFGVSKTQTVSLKANCIQPLFFTVKADKTGARTEKAKSPLQQKTIRCRLTFCLT